MDINDILECNGLSIEILQSFSYKSQLGLSLKKTLRHFDKDELLSEIFDYTDWLLNKNISEVVSLDYRIKALKSIELKYNRYYPDRQVNKVFNDILGMRAICSDYTSILNCDNKEFNVADMSNGKKNDDGYRGVHVYYQIDNFYYPIEIQFNTMFDRQLNDWLHDYIYKKNYPLFYGKEIRLLYEQGHIHNLCDFEEVLYGLLSSKELQ